MRYFRKTVDLEDNLYGIDENQIYFGGNSAGGVIAVHAAFMQEEDITDPALLAALNALGGIEGNSGNDGYSSEVRGAISLAGALADVNFITTDEKDKLLISCHGDADNVVPYSCGQPLGSAILPELCGGGAMLSHTEAINFTNHQHLLFPDAGHVPWEYAGDSQDQMITFVSDNLYSALDCMNIGVEEISANKMTVYPNPTRDVFSVETETPNSMVSVYNLNGSLLLQLENTKSVNIQCLPKGIYIVKLTDAMQQSQYTRVTKL